MFSTTRSTLGVDGFQGTTLGVLLAVGLLGARGGTHAPPPAHLGAMALLLGWRY
jgi:hypothetical protein